MENHARLDEVIATLRRQRVRQGDLIPVLDCIIAQATILRCRPASAAVNAAAEEMASSARDLKRSVHCLPKFVVEDLLEEIVAKLERAASDSPAPEGNNGASGLPRDKRMP